MGGEAVPMQGRCQSCLDMWLAPEPFWLLRVPRQRVFANRLDKVLNTLDLAGTLIRHFSVIALRAARRPSQNSVPSVGRVLTTLKPFHISEGKSTIFRGTRKKL